MEPLRADVLSLEQRGQAACRRGKQIMAAAGVLALAATVAWGMGNWIAPSAALREIHVPPEVVDMFPDTVQIGSGLIGSHLEAALDPINRFMASKLLFVIPGLVFILAGIHAIFTRSSDVLTRVAVTTIALLIPLFVFSMAVIDKSKVAGAALSTRTELKRLAESADVMGLEKMLKDANPGVRNYVLAQASVVNEVVQKVPVNRDALTAMVRQIDETARLGGRWFDHVHTAV